MCEWNQTVEDHYLWHHSISTFSKVHNWEDQMSFRIDSSRLRLSLTDKADMIFSSRLFELVARRAVHDSIVPSSGSVAPCDEKDSKVDVFVRFSRPSLFGVGTATQVQVFVHPLTVCHECPLFSQQQSCCIVSNTQRTSIQITFLKLISVSRLEHVHLRQH